MIEVMYAYGYVSLYTYIHFYWKEQYHANECQKVSLSHYALPMSTTLLRRWYYVNAVPTTLVLRSYSISLVATLLLRKF